MGLSHVLSVNFLGAWQNIRRNTLRNCALHGLVFGLLQVGVTHATPPPPDSYVAPYSYSCRNGDFCSVPAAIQTYCDYLGMGSPSRIDSGVPGIPPSPIYFSCYSGGTWYPYPSWLYPVPINSTYFCPYGGTIGYFDSGVYCFNPPACPPGETRNPDTGICVPQCQKDCGPVCPGIGIAGAGTGTTGKRLAAAGAGLY